MRTITVALLAMSIALPSALADHPDPEPAGQHWILQEDGFMTRGGHAENAGENTSILDGDTAHWCADEPAILNYDMRGNTFSVGAQLLQGTDLQFSAGKCDIADVYIPCAFDTVITANPSLSATVDSHDVEHARAVRVNRTISVSATAGDECVVKIGERLAAGIAATNGPAKVGHHEIPGLPLRPATAPSGFGSASTPPTYPTPELSALLLTGVGLVGIALYVRRR